MKNFPDLPPIWTLGAMTLSAAFVWVWPIFSWESFGFRLFGVFWIGLALALIVWSAIWFRAKKTTIEPHQLPNSLIVEGPYRLSRNPIYLAMVAGALGFTIWLGGLSGLLPVLGLAGVLQRRFVLPEEAGLLATFGDEAKDYIAKTKRWV